MYHNIVVIQFLTHCLLIFNQKRFDALQTYFFPFTQFSFNFYLDFLRLTFLHLHPLPSPPLSLIPPLFRLLLP